MRKIWPRHKYPTNGAYYEKTRIIKLSEVQITSPTILRDVLCHECAHALHIKRGDEGEEHGNEFWSILNEIAAHFVGSDIDVTRT